MKIKHLTLLILLSSGSALATTSHLEVSPIILRGVPFEVILEGAGLEILSVKSGDQRLEIGGIDSTAAGIIIHGLLSPALGRTALTVLTSEGAYTGSAYTLPGITSILPPVIAIALALLTKQVVLSLFCGIWFGAFLTLAGSFNPFTAFLTTMDSYLMRALTDPDHMSIVLFTMTLGGMVGIVARSGGTHGIVLALAKYANTRRSGQLATWFMGIIIFFDDYSNTLLVGNTMRPFTDKLRISREKLSYLVDSTSAPIASIALASTWIGFELGLLDSAFTDLGLERSAYMTFLSAIPYSFYSIMALLMVVLIAYSGRDFGPMYAAEKRSITENKVLRDGAKPLLDQELAGLLPPEGVQSHWSAAVIPIGTMIIVLAVGLYVNGKQALGAGDFPLREIIGAANSFVVLIWTSAIGAVTAGVLAVSKRLLSVGETVDAFLIGFKAMIVGIIILTLARGLQLVTGDLQTADYIFAMTSEILNPHLLPVITFIIAALISFSTGTSFGTMAILVPLVIPLAYNIPTEAGLSAALSESILLASIGAILSGAIFGDHCSPISDTTVMSSMASGADHIDHVRTQLPIGLLVAGVTLVLGYLPAGFGWSPWLGNFLALIVLGGILWRFGKDPEAESTLA